MRRRIALSAATGTAVLLALVGCGKADAPVAPTADAPPATVPTPAPVVSATAPLAAASGSTVRGALSLTAEEGGVLLRGQLTGLDPGTEHGFHVHETGDCSARDASTAGEHLNPAGGRHGGPGAAERHLGDLPNIQADGQGGAAVEARLPGATLRDGAPTDLLGKAVVVHRKRDDYQSQPAGDSGDRIACGVIS
jgi:superoxide dismutase, Cu-Zn family